MNRYSEDLKDKAVVELSRHGALGGGSVLMLGTWRDDGCAPTHEAHLGCERFTAIASIIAVVAKRR